MPDGAFGHSTGCHRSSQGKQSRLTVLSPAADQPEPESPGHRQGKTEPGDCVLQVVVVEMDLKRAGFRHAAWRCRRFEIDIKRRDRAPAERLCHAVGIANKPKPLCGILTRGEKSRLLR